MTYADGNWAPVIIMVMVNSAIGLSNALVKKVLDGGINHMVVATYRIAISTLFLAPIAFFLERKTRPKLTLNILVQLFFSALLGASLTQYFILLGLSYTSATLTSAFLSMIPAITFVLSLIFRVEKLNMKSKSGICMVIGTFSCIGGALLLTMYEGVPLTRLHKLETHPMHNEPAIKPQNRIIGCVLLFAGDTCFGLWMLMQSKVNEKYPCQYSNIVILSFFGTIQCALISLIKSRDIAAWVVKDKFDIMIIIYAGALTQGICNVGTSWCIRKRGPIFTSIFIPVGLIFAALFDILILHRQLFVGSVMGSVVVIFGLYIFLLGKVRQMKEGSANKLPSHVCKEEEGKGEDDEQSKKCQLMVVPTSP